MTERIAISVPDGQEGGSVMKKQRNGQERGSAHLILVLLLVVILLGILGFVFYQNFMAPRSSQPQPKIEQNTKPVLKTASFTFQGTKYALDYPEGWSESALDNSSEQRDMKISNPAQSIEVRLDVSSGGLGGMCDPNDGLKVRYYTVSETANTKLTGESLRLVAAMSDYSEGGYRYTIGLSPEGAETHASVGDSHCTVGYVGVASRLVVDPTTSEIIRPTIIARIQFPKLPDANNSTVKSMDTIKDLIATDDYKAAVKILESARTE